MLNYISHDQLQQDEGEVGGVTSPEDVVVVLHLADGQQHRKRVRWKMVPLLKLMLSYILHDQLQQDEAEAGGSPVLKLLLSSISWQ